MSILMAGSVLFDVAKPGENPSWLIILSGVAALLAILDMVIGYGKFASLHTQLRSKFADLEIRLVTTDSLDGKLWQEFHRERLLIEKDELPIYKVLDLLCRNELLESEGHRRETASKLFFTPTWFQKLTSQLFRWDNVQFEPS